MKAGADTSARFEAIEHPSGVTHQGEFLTSAGEQLYAASYLPKGTANVGVLLCPSWGVEAARHMGWTHQFAHDLALKGAAAVLVQWPGTEDSEGDVTALTLDRLVDAAVDTRAALATRCDPGRWCVVGSRVGAAPAALVASAISAAHLVLVQPELDLPEHFSELERLSRRGRLGAATSPDWAFGVPSPRGLRREEDRDRIADAVRAFGRRATLVRYRRPKHQVDPPGVRVVRVWGEWTTSASVDHLSLRAAAVRAIVRAARGDK